MLNTFQASALEGQRHPRQEGRLRHRRHPDQVRRRARIRQAHDRERRRDHDHRRLVLGRGRCRAGAVPGSRHHLHGRPDPLQRHHRQGQAGQRLPSLLQRLHVGRRARPGAGEGLRQGPRRLPPDRRLHLGLDPGGVDQELDRGSRLEDRRSGPTPLGAGDFSPVHHAGAQLRRRRADPEPLRQGHGQLADPGGSVRPARQAGQRQELRDRRAALLAPDGAGCRRQHQGHLRLHQLELVAAGRRLPGVRQVVRREVRLPAVAGRPHLLRADAALRRRLRAGRHLRAVRQSSRRWKASSSTAWATARRCTAPKTTSASRTSWS